MIDETNIRRGLIFVVTLAFMAGTLFGGWLLKPSGTNHDTVVNKLDALAMVCAKPVPKGEVVISAEDIIDAVRGKNLEFVAVVE